jgi:hypothetical protein
MIAINIEQSNENDKKGEYTFHKNLIYIGRDTGSDLYLEDLKLNMNHLFIEVIDSKILCHLSKNTKFILINGKRTTGYKEIKLGDKIKVGDCIFSVSAALAIKEESYREQLNKITEKILAEAPELVGILKDIQKSGE